MLVNAKKIENINLFILQLRFEHVRRNMLQKIQDKIRITWKGSLNKESARMNLAKNNNVVILKTISEHVESNRNVTIFLFHLNKNISLLKKEAPFLKSVETEKTEVLKMRKPDVEQSTLLNCFPGYCWKSLIEEPYSNNLVSGSCRFSSSTLLTFWGVINN